MALERPDLDSRWTNTADASPLIVSGIAEFDGFVLKNKRGRVRFRARVVEQLPVDGCLSMGESERLGINILMRRK